MDKPRGRPPLPPDQRRSQTVLVSLTPDDAAKLQRAAQRMGKRPSWLAHRYILTLLRTEIGD